MEDIDVFYMDPSFIDLQVYDLWLQGFSGECVIENGFGAFSFLTALRLNTSFIA